MNLRIFGSVSLVISGQPMTTHQRRCRTIWNNAEHNPKVEPLRASATPVEQQQ
jgi:hypothetical protein